MARKSDEKRITNKPTTDKKTSAQKYFLYSGFTDVRSGKSIEDTGEKYSSFGRDSSIKKGIPEACVDVTFKRPSTGDIRSRKHSHFNESSYKDRDLEHHPLKESILSNGRVETEYLQKFLNKNCKSSSTSPSKNHITKVTEDFIKNRLKTVTEEYRQYSTSDRRDSSYDMSKQRTSDNTSRKKYSNSENLCHVDKLKVKRNLDKTIFKRM